ncbi:MAG: hypothetical protein ABIS36_20300 [Chryseolinea sp.]
MPLKTLVKVGGLTNLSDARYCAGMGVEMIGFQVIPGMPCFVAPEKYQEIRGWISGPSIVAEIYGIKDRALITKIIEGYKPDYFELGIDDLAITGNLSIPFILALQTGQALPMLSSLPTYVLSREKLSLPAGIRSMLEVSSGEEAINAIKGCNIAAIATSGSAEVRPGYKDYDELASILEALEED